MNILIVEDDKRISEFLESSLRAIQYNVIVCESIAEVETLIQQQHSEIDIVLLDRMIGQDEGGTLVSPLRKKFPAVGIIILSSLDSPTEKAKWLDLGIEDYVGKPFSFEELSARIRNVFRNKNRSQISQTHFLVLKNLKLDLLSQQCRVDQSLLNLTKKELQLLLLLVEKPGRIFNKNQILDRVWQIDSAVESNVVEVTVKNLRKKLEEAQAQVNIKSRRNMGYWIEE
jgi:two-component system, OmpR family, response regulator